MYAKMDKYAKMCTLKFYSETRFRINYSHIKNIRKDSFNIQKRVSEKITPTSNLFGNAFHKLRGSH